MARPLTGRSPLLTTYLLRPEGEPSEMLARFIECLIRISNELY
ncbi:LysR family transcriptional regulator [Pseudomonas putida JB]|nr:LysR family transcriptional regulator [Pseudomonas putida BIRD-1]AOX08697.1 LysR family transcriptional regulator [Pseudomonas putida JB]NBA81667.1 LysR family transcriptional regulator [Pseudomonas putida]PWY38956.1 LysR family transcriptional regulator [Pseudomonas sp. RW405]HBK47855.1 LysR family transcriptional regulator [Pseudomonas sp.]